MENTVQPFKNPIYVTRPLLPDLNMVIENLGEIWNSKWVTNNGPKHVEFENKLKDMLKVAQVSLFNNGTSALLVALKSLQLTGEVITTPFTFAATPHVLIWNQLKPVFCDIDPVTMNIDVNKIEPLISPKTSAILPVHVFGNPCEVEKIQKIADSYNLKVIYDAAHAFGVELNNVGIGNFGDISMMSFHATKLFHTAEGGALTYRDKGLKAYIDLLKNFGIKNEEEVLLPGINGKMNEIQAAIGLVVLKYVEKEQEKRRILIEAYRHCLEEVEGINFLKDIPNVKSNHQYFVIRIDESAFGCPRDIVYERFKEYNIFTRKYFYPLCSNYPCYSHLSSSAIDNLPIANKVAEEVLSMPLYGELSVGDVEKICNILKSFR